MSDITERKLAQARAARSDKLRALGELAAGVAHNLNNSLTVIQGRAQLLLMRSSTADEGNKKSLGVITQAVGDCSQTLRRLFDFSRRESLLNDAFRAQGHEVVEAATGAEALKHLDDRDFDLMVCDLGLPELSGLHVARWVKEFSRELPVIIATGFSEMIAEEDYQKARINEVIRKPYGVGDVLARAHAILSIQGDENRETVLV